MSLCCMDIMDIICVADFRNRRMHSTAALVLGKIGT